MNHRIIFFLLILFTNLHAQNKHVISWINANAILIEDTNPDAPLTMFSQNVPSSFKNARIFGFGEASHHGKEFFDLKAKYFRYLVEHEGVTLFIMEESYQAEKGINEWISGGEGDKFAALKNFGHGIWYCKEIADLLQWMRDYNNGKPREKQIRFYGMDNQFGEDINTRLREYVKKHDIMIDETLLVAVDSCSATQFKLGGIKYGPDSILPKLSQVKKLLKQDEARLISDNAAEYKDMMRGLDYLEQYISYTAFPYSNDSRDRDMYNNVLQILNIEGKESKAFIWAHNEHINKKNLGGYDIRNLGSRLKEGFKETYYCVGFDFGKGVMKGYVSKKGKITGAVYRSLDKPYKKTFAETLIEAQPDIYFIDMTATIDDVEVRKFFSTKNKQLFLGGPGFDPKHTTFIKRSYTEAYDGLIFVKVISPTTY